VTVATRARKPLPDPDPDLLERGGFITTPELAVFLRKSPGTLDQWASRGGGPKFIKPGRDRLYRADDVKAWLAAKEREQEVRVQERHGDAA
jgi:hypothetical protein